MKKILSACTMLLLLFFYSFFTMAKAEIPSSIYALLPQAEITSTAFWEEDTRNTCFVLTHKEDGTNTLYCFIHENSIWAECFHTEDGRSIEQNIVFQREDLDTWNLIFL